MYEDSFHLGVKALIINSQGKILLLQVNEKKLKNNTKGAYWDIPGGRIQRGCSIEQTLRRELQEETGIETIASIKPLSMVLSNIRIPTIPLDVGLILSIYICEVDAASTIVLSDEHIAYNWFSTEQASDLLSVKYPQEFTHQLAKLSVSL